MDRLKVLKELVAKRIGISSDLLDEKVAFRDYGLHSLQFTSLINDINSYFHANINLNIIWEYPTIQRLHRYLSGIENDSFKRNTSLLPIYDNSDPIAVVGLACRFPGATGIHEFWQLLQQGRSEITEIPITRWQRGLSASQFAEIKRMTSYSYAGMIDNPTTFDAEFFKIKPTEACAMDPQQRWMLELTWEAFYSAGISPCDLGTRNIGVFIGSIWGDYANCLNSHKQVNAYTGIGTSRNIIANRISYQFDLQGPSLVVDTACSSSLVATHLAMQSLRCQESELAIVGGVNVMLSSMTMQALQKFGGLSPSEIYRAFDVKSDGYIRGEGAGVIILQPLSKAIYAGRHIWCILKGSATNNDGETNGLTAPNPAAQRAIYVAACHRAGIDYDDVQYIEAHGTGTPLGDPIEIQSIAEVYATDARRNASLFIGSVKPNIGHLEGASGIAGLIKTILALYHQKIPPQINLITVNFDIQKYIRNNNIIFPLKLTEWPYQSSQENCAAVSSFGWGGTNCHIILQSFCKHLPFKKRRNMPKQQRIAFLFSGHGSQWQGMGQKLIHEEPIFRFIIDQIGQLFIDVGYELLIKDELIQPKHIHTWSNPAIGQPLIFAIQIGIIHVLAEVGIFPDAVIGHSLGGIAAAYAADSITLMEAVKLVYLYSQAQAQVTPTGKMLAVGMDAKLLQKKLLDYQELHIAGIISLETTIVAGPAKIIMCLHQALQEQNVFSALIAVDVAAHTSYMEQIAPKLKEIAWLKPSRTHVPFYSTTLGSRVAGQKLNVQYWVDDLCSCPNIIKTIRKATQDGINTFIEISPHATMVTDIIKLRKLIPNHYIALPASNRGDELNRLNIVKQLNSSTLDKQVCENLSTTQASCLGKKILLLSSHTSQSLQQMAKGLIPLIRSNSLNHICYTLNRYTPWHNFRLSIIIENKDEVLEVLRKFSQMAITKNNISKKNFCYKKHESNDVRCKNVFLCQGFSYLLQNNIKNLIINLPFLKRRLEQFSSYTLENYNWSILEEINLGNHGVKYTQHSIVILCAIQIAMIDQWEQLGIMLDIVLGFGIGEISAAYAAGGLDEFVAIDMAYQIGRIISKIPSEPVLLYVNASEAKILKLLGGQRISHAAHIVAYYNDTELMLSIDSKVLQRVKAICLHHEIQHHEVDRGCALHTPIISQIKQELLEKLAPLHKIKGNKQRKCLFYSGSIGDKLDINRLNSQYFYEGILNPARISAAIDNLHAAHPNILLSTLLMNNAPKFFKESENSNINFSYEKKDADNNPYDNFLKNISYFFIKNKNIKRSQLPPYYGSIVPLLRYVWQGQDYWHESLSDQQLPSKTCYSELVEFHSPLFLPDKRVFMISLSIENAPELASHCIDHNVYFPASGFIGLAYLIVKQTSPKISNLLFFKNNLFERSLPLKAGHSYKIQLIANEAKDNTIRCYYQLDKQWHQCSSLEIATFKGMPESERLNYLLKNITVKKNVAEFYQYVAKFKLNYGADFKYINEIYVNKIKSKEVLSHIKIPYKLSMQFMHPTLMLDHCIQTFAVILHSTQFVANNIDVIIQPASIDAIALSGNLPHEFWCYTFAFNVDYQTKTINFDCMLYAISGKVIGIIKNVSLRFFRQVHCLDNRENKVNFYRENDVQEKKTNLMAFSGNKIVISHKIESAIINKITLLLNLEDAKNIKLNQSLIEMGMDSLGLVELRNELRQLTGLSLSTALLFSHPTINDLTSHISDILCSASDKQQQSNSLGKGNNEVKPLFKATEKNQKNRVNKRGKLTDLEINLLLEEKINKWT